MLNKGNKASYYAHNRERLLSIIESRLSKFEGLLIIY